MTGKASVLGSLHSVEGEGVVRMENRLDTGIDDLWGALYRSRATRPLVRRGRGRAFSGGRVPSVRITLAGERTGKVKT